MKTSPTTEPVLRPRPTLRRRSLTFLRDILIIVLVAVTVSFLVKTFLVRSFYIPSGSMENTLQINDRILVNELVPSVVPLQRGDVVVFSDPGGWLNPAETSSAQGGLAQVTGAFLTFIGLGVSDSNNHLIKRVIGLPGDHVTCCNPLGQIEVNGSPIIEPYTHEPAGTAPAGAVTFDVTVPANSLWVMGDNRYNSQDSSRNQELPGKGFVPISDVVGRAVVITWPIDRWQVLDDYPNVFRGVGSAPTG
ncbi:signal peptidase I [Rathayibacter sp. VKM Ac-2879]|uniref:signal peptidase I n=1 Tax=unclassified Rathayibacter TaxID=2609250 RepID=UPI003A5B9380